MAMTAIFNIMLYDCLEDYADNIVVKTREALNHVNGLRRVFEYAKEQA